MAIVELREFEASAEVSYDPPTRTGTWEAKERKAFCSRVQPIIVSGRQDSTQRVPTASDAPGSSW